MKTIPLTQGKFALVDDADFEELSKHRWCAAKDHCYNRWYACRAEKINGQYKTIKMHRLIMNTPKGMHTDHINHDGLDNRRINLRVCTNQQNLFNHQKRQNCSSKYKGVIWEVNKWTARIKYNNKSTRLGHFDNEIDAARAYDENAKRLYGEYASVNFPQKSKVG
jgi:hypothetical protein